MDRGGCLVLGPSTELNRNGIRFLLTGVPRRPTRRSLSTDVAVSGVAETVTTDPTTAAIRALAAATCGAPTAGVSGWDCSRSGAKRVDGAWKGSTLSLPSW